QQSHRQNGGGGVGDPLAGDVGGAAVHRLEHARVAPADVQVAAGGKSDTTGDGGGHVGDDLIEPARVGHHVDRGGVDVLVGDAHVGVLERHLLHDSRPQTAGVHHD